MPDARPALHPELRKSNLLGVSILILALVFGATGCVTRFQTGVRLLPDQQRIVAADLAVAGVLARRPGESGASVPEAAARLARLAGVEDRSAMLSEQDLRILLASPSEIRESAGELESLARRLGHRYVLVGEASTAPTDELKTWIIQVVLPIPYFWISFGIPVHYASTIDAPHSTVSTRVIDLERGEVLAASFAVRSNIDPDATLPFRNATASRAIKRMALRKP